MKDVLTEVGLHHFEALHGKLEFNVSRLSFLEPQSILRPNPISTPYPFPLPLQNKG